MEDDELIISQLANSIRKKFSNLPPVSSKCCIYKIPRTLREANKSVYKPCLISFGPFHHGKKNLQPFQEHKFRYLQHFLKRNIKKNLSDYLTQVRLWETQVREYYIDNIELDSEEFNEMVLLDGCFLIEFFLVWLLGEADENDCIFKKPSVEVVIMRDVLLLENQLPFFVLDGLYNIAFGDDELVHTENPESATDDDESVILSNYIKSSSSATDGNDELVIPSNHIENSGSIIDSDDELVIPSNHKKPRFTIDGDDELVISSNHIENPESATNGDDELVILPNHIENHRSDTDADDVSSRSMPTFIDLCCKVLVGESKGILKNFDDDIPVLHLLDFLRTCYLPSILRHRNDIGNSNNLEFPPSVERLHDAGIKFELAKNEPLLDIEFSNGVLKIPRLEVEDHTEALLLNLSAFEQCHYHSDSYVVDYVVLMDVLITSLKDVDILMSEGIIMNSLGNTEDLANIFNTICKGTNYQARRFYYSHLSRQLNAYYRTPWNKWKETLKQEYFSNPWTIISVIAAVVLLILTIVQTICTVVSMKN